MFPEIFGQSQAELLGVGFKHLDFVINPLRGIASDDFVIVSENITSLKIHSFSDKNITDIVCIIRIYRNRIFRGAVHICRHEGPAVVFENQIAKERTQSSWFEQ